MNISISQAVVHVPANVTVHDTANPVYRFLHKQWSRFRAVMVQKGRPTLPKAAERILKRYAYRGRHFAKPGEVAETRVHGGTPQEYRREVVIPGTPTLRTRIKQARANRRQSVRTPLHDTGAYPVIRDPFFRAVDTSETTWSWQTAPQWLAREQRKATDAQLILSGAEGPLSS